MDSTVNVIWCAEDEEENISEEVKNHYEFVNEFMMQNFDYFWPRNVRVTQDLIRIVKHNTLCDIQSKKLVVPKKKLIKQILMADSKSTGISFQTHVVESKNRERSESSSTDENSRRTTNKAKATGAKSRRKSVDNSENLDEKQSDKPGKAAESVETTASLYRMQLSLDKVIKTRQMQQAAIEAFLVGRMNQHTSVDQPATIQPAKDQQPVTLPLSSTSGVRVSFLPS